MSEKKFDIASYEENISMLLSMARDEYKRHFIELPAIQDKTIKTYLWISGALLGLQITVLDKLGRLPASSLFWIIVSFILSFLSFCFGIDSLRGREASSFGVKSYSDLLDKTFSLGRSSDSTRKLNISLIKFFETAIDAEKRINIWRAKRQRYMSYLLLFSGVSTGMTVICYFID